MNPPISGGERGGWSCDSNKEGLQRIVSVMKGKVVLTDPPYTCAREVAE
jgi:hypothetical protein